MIRAGCLFRKVRPLQGAVVLRCAVLLQLEVCVADLGLPTATSSVFLRCAGAMLQSGQGGIWGKCEARQQSSSCRYLRVAVVSPYPTRWRIQVMRRRECIRYAPAMMRAMITVVVSVRVAPGKVAVCINGTWRRQRRIMRINQWERGRSWNLFSVRVVFGRGQWAQTGTG